MRTEICQASQAWWYLLNPHTLQVEALRDTENSSCFLTDQLGSVARFENTEGQRRERLPQALELQVKKFRLHSEGTRLYRGLVHRLESIRCQPLKHFYHFHLPPVDTQDVIWFSVGLESSLSAHRVPPLAGFVSPSPRCPLPPFLFHVGLSPLCSQRAESEMPASLPFSC